MKCQTKLFPPSIYFILLPFPCWTFCIHNLGLKFPLIFWISWKRYFVILFYFFSLIIVIIIFVSAWSPLSMLTTRHPFIFKKVSLLVTVPFILVLCSSLVVDWVPSDLGVPSSSSNSHFILVSSHSFRSQKYWKVAHHWLLSLIITAVVSERSSIVTVPSPSPMEQFILFCWCEEYACNLVLCLSFD